MASAMAAAIVCGCGAKPADAPVEEPAVESEVAEDAAETAEEVTEDAAEEGIKAEGVSDLKKPAEDASAEEKLEYALAEISNAESMDMGIHIYGNNSCCPSSSSGKETIYCSPSPVWAPYSYATR